MRHDLRSAHRYRRHDAHSGRLLLHEFGAKYRGLTLDAQGDPDAVWVFKVGSTLITSVNSSVNLVNGAQQCNVFWQVGSSATIGVGSDFVGSILALTSITLNTNAQVLGRALARNGAVTMDNNVVTVATCAEPPTPVIPPTLGKAFSPATVAAGGLSTLTITLSNPDLTAATLDAPLTDTLPAGVTVAGAGSTTCGGTVSTTANSVTLTGGSIPATGSCTVSVPVSAATGGTYINSLAIGALSTSNGDNAAPAVATLTVPEAATAPTVGKAFSPAVIAQGGTSTLTITLNNTDDSIAALTAPLVDTLPSGVTVTGAGSTTCGGAVTNTASSVTLTGGAIPANGSCTVQCAGDFGYWRQLRQLRERRCAADQQWQQRGSGHRDLDGQRSGRRHAHARQGL